jgi:hypothetical protein
MSDTQSKSFRLHRPGCPQCHHQAPRMDTGVGNLWRIPLATLSALLLYPLVGIRFRCARCSCRFVASRDAAAVGGML